MALFGREPISVSTHSTEANGIINSAQVLLDFETASATCEANWISPVKIRRVEVTGTDEYCVVDMIRQEVSLLALRERQPMIVPKQEPLKEELSAFVDAIRTGCRDGIVTGEDALRTLEVTLQAAGV